MKFIHFLQFALPFAAVFLMAACGSNSLRTGESPLEQPVLEISEGGGFTGMFLVYRIDRHGNLEKWSSRAGKLDTLLWKGKIPADTVRNWVKDLKNTGALEWTYQKPGNMSETVIYWQDEKRFMWTWTPSVGKKILPVAFYRWYRRVRTFLDATTR
jgi:hypothetical protein